MTGRTKIQFTELAAWMAQNGKKLRPLARDAKIDKMTLHRLLTGKPKRFDPDIIRKISGVTGGAIGEEQFTAYFARLAAPKRRAA